MRQVIDCVRTVVEAPDWNSPADAELLSCFVRDGDGAAFAALVRRHGRLVLGVCQRVLRDHHDAEDAFQAVFLILARKATMVKTPERLANWLYGVAYNTARKSRAMTNRRRRREPFAADLRELPEPTTDPKYSREELRALLDFELARLPNDYRIAIILCDLEGRSQRDAASHLGWAEGTLSGRLFRAREMLAKRLLRRGFVVPASGFGLWLSQIAAAADELHLATHNRVRMTTQWLTAERIPARLATLVNEATTAMILSKLSVVFTVLLGIALASAAVSGQSEPSGVESQRSASVRFAGTNQDDKKSAEKVDGENEALQKGWLLVARELDGKREEFPQGVGIKMWIKKDELDVHSVLINAFFGEGRNVVSETKHYRVDPKKNPKTIDIIWPDRTVTKPWMMGIYKLEKDRLIICWAMPDKDRPDDFTAKAKSNRMLVEYKQIKAEDVEP